MSETREQKRERLWRRFSGPETRKLMGPEAMLEIVESAERAAAQRARDEAARSVEAQKLVTPAGLMQSIESQVYNKALGDALAILRQASIPAPGPTPGEPDESGGVGLELCMHGIARGFCSACPPRSETMAQPEPNTASGDKATFVKGGYDAAIVALEKRVEALEQKTRSALNLLEKIANARLHTPQAPSKFSPDPHRWDEKL